MHIHSVSACFHLEIQSRLRSAFGEVGLLPRRTHNRSARTRRYVARPVCVERFDDFIPKLVSMSVGPATSPASAVLHIFVCCFPSRQPTASSVNVKVKEKVMV